MIAATAINEPSPHVKSRGRKMRVKTLAFDSYLVTPPEPGKLKRLVHFDVSEAGAVKIECASLDGDVCEANSYSRHCSHVEAAVRRLERNIRKEEAKHKKAESELKRSKRVSREIKKRPSQKSLIG